MRLPAAAVATLLLPLVLAPPACDTCGPPERCFYATLLLLVYDAETGDPLPDATVSQASGPLSTDLTPLSCAGGQCTHAVSPGAGPVTISRSGYTDAFVDFIPRSDACGAPFRQFASIGMRPLSDALSAPVVTGPDDRGAGCN
jgi:hypothetical protein